MRCGPDAGFRSLEPTGRFATLKHVAGCDPCRRHARTSCPATVTPRLPRDSCRDCSGGQQRTSARAVAERGHIADASGGYGDRRATTTREHSAIRVGRAHGQAQGRARSPSGRGREFDDRDAVRSNAGLWGLGALLLAIVLGGQLAHYFRQDCCAIPNLGPAMRRIYERLDVRLEPNWDLRAYELRQWGASDTVPVAGIDDRARKHQESRRLTRNRCPCCASISKTDSAAVSRRRDFEAT